MCGSVAEWSKALVLGTSLFGGVGSNPTAARTYFLYCYYHKKYSKLELRCVQILAKTPNWFDGYERHKSKL